jgi:hypothetical protein
VPNAAGLIGLLAVALVASSQVASAAPKDKVEVLDGATLDDPNREPKPVPGGRSRCSIAPIEGSRPSCAPALAPVTPTRSGT